MHRGRTLRRNGRKPGEDVIITELEKGPGTFTELKTRCGLADSTLSEHLKTLEDKGEITREYMEGKLLIKLTDKAASPLEKTLRHLEALSPHKLDIEVGRKLLTDEFMDVIFYKHFNGVKRKIEEFGVKFNEKEIGIEFNEYYLLKVIAKFNTELSFVEGLKKDENTPLWMCIPPELTKILKKKIDDPELFPALGAARRIGVINQFEALLNWISPLLESHEEAKMRKTSPEWVSMAGKHLMVLSPWNLAAAVFIAEERDYFKKVLSPLWCDKLHDATTRRKQKKKKGRK